MSPARPELDPDIITTQPTTTRLLYPLLGILPR